jgi:hypothetical protein
MLAYGGLLLLVAIWAVATSFAKHSEGSKTEAVAKPAPKPMPETDEEARKVIHALRASGWYIADDVALPNIDVDHIAVGPAGVLAVQVMWTNRPDDRAKPAIRARIGAQQLRQVLASRELTVDVVPAVIAFGPGLTDEPGGVKVVDSVAILFGDQADLWISELSRRRLLVEDTVDAVRAVVGDLREGVFQPAAHTPVTVREPVLV